MSGSDQGLDGVRGSDMERWFVDQEQRPPSDLVQRIALRTEGVRQRRRLPWPLRHPDTGSRRRTLAVALIATGALAVAGVVGAPSVTRPSPVIVGPAASPSTPASSPGTLCATTGVPGPNDRLDGIWHRDGDTTVVREAHGAVWMVGLSEGAPMAAEWMYAIRADRTPAGLTGRVADLYSDRLPLAGPIEMSLDEIFVARRPAITIQDWPSDFNSQPWSPRCPPDDPGELLSRSAKPGVESGLAVARRTTAACRPAERDEAGWWGTWGGADWDVVYVRRVNVRWWLLALSADRDGRGAGRDAAILLAGEEQGGDRVEAQWVDLVTGRAGTGVLSPGDDETIAWADREGDAGLGVLEPCSWE
jgi:hypothetical protein